MSSAPKGQLQRIGAASDADAVAGAAVRRQLTFEAADALAQDQPPERAT